MDSVRESQETLEKAASLEEASGQVRDTEQNAQLYRQIDWHIMPLMFLCYFLQFLDKVVLNYANIMGLTTSLHMDTNQFSWLASAFFIAYAVAEFPQGYLLQKFPISKILGVNVFLWGITLCCTAAAKSFASIAALGVLLGCFEAIISPALIMITSQWYTKRMGTPRVGIWYCGLDAGQIIGGLISFGAQHGDATASFSGWRIMFVAVGAFNILVAVAVILFLPNNVDSASFLSEDEKVAIHDLLILDQGGNGKKVFKFWSLWETAADLQVWLLFILTILIAIPSGVITTFSAVLIKGFGYTAKQSALLNMPSGAVSIFATLICTFAILKNFPRWLGICVLMAPTLIGAGLMSFYKGTRGGVLAGIYLINFDVAPLALIYALVGGNTQGYTKRVATNAIVAIGFSVANIIGPQTFRTHEAPGYISAKITIFAVNGASIVVAVLLRLLYGNRNRKRMQNRKMQLDAVGRGEMTVKEIEEDDMTDVTNTAFVYNY
ncbi:putative allantoate permease [Rhizodiscina lignyota]|uniref:Allantoate permease n=1 Tax=Rhizodiscina lignyota TaxID=1504668 RepID=A0A9P4I0D2_9PEZI|nr:putative allantoate permease [Rhizodiscina lignyota]